MTRRTAICTATLLTGILSAGAVEYPLHTYSLTQLEQRLVQLDNELEQLARASLRSGVGAVGWRSDPHTGPSNAEWVRVALEAMPFLRQTVPDARIVVLTQSDREADVLRAIRLGAAGYLLMSSSVKQITEGIRTVMEGGASLDPGVARFIPRTLQAKPPAREVERPLSEREMEILTLLAQGLVKKEIAGRLGIGMSTVVTHVSHIYEKLNASNAPSAIHKAHHLGLFSPDSAETRNPYASQWISTSAI